MSVKSVSRRKNLLYGSIAGAILLATSALALVALSTTALKVLGQFNFTHASANLPDAASSDLPAGVALDTSGVATGQPVRLYVADTQNNRVLGFSNVSTLITGAPADIIFGQPDFQLTSCNFNGTGGGATATSLCGPTSVAVDHAGNVYISDRGNNRVLAFSKPPAGAMDPAAKFVLGQAGDFTAHGCNFGGGPSYESAETLCGPQQLAVDSHNNLYVADFTNNRVLEYNTPLTVTSTPGSGDYIPDMLFGQPAYESAAASACNQGGGPSPITLCGPSGVTIDSSGNLWVADSTNNRVLEYNAPLTVPDMAASFSLGQGGGTGSALCNFGAGSPTAASLCNPTAVAVDASKNLYVTDTNNSRVLGYANPLLNGQNAKLVFGQLGIFTAGHANLGGSEASGFTLSAPLGVGVDNKAKLYVADTGNNRVLIFNTPTTAPTGEPSADIALFQVNLFSNTPNLVDAEAMNLVSGTGLPSPGGNSLLPSSVVVDTHSTPPHLYVTDTANSRVLGYNSAGTFASGASADLVIGQADLTGGACNSNDVSGLGPQSLCNPSGLAIDSLGNLYVADSRNHRILEFGAPFSSGYTAAQPADNVWGQGFDFYSNQCNLGGSSPGAETLCTPTGLAIDASNNLWVADSGNNRVLLFRNPLNNANANLVFGQFSDFTTSACNKLSNTTADTLCHPTGVAMVTAGTTPPIGTVMIADRDNSRVLGYLNPLAAGGGTPGTPGFAGDTTADFVFGQIGSFTTSTCDIRQSGVFGNDILCFPESVLVDSADHLFIGDTANNRVLHYPAPFGGGTYWRSDTVFGQGDNEGTGLCNLGGSGPASTTLCAPLGTAMDAAGNLFISDASNNRVLWYDPPRLSAGTVSFSTEAVGSGATKTIKLYSDSITTNISSISIQEVKGAGFGVTNNCPPQLLPRSSCTITVTFKPLIPGLFSTTLTVRDSAYNSPQKARVTGSAQ